MADKNLARSGTADTDLLADDDPLSELARIVGYEPRPTRQAVQPASVTEVRPDTELPPASAGRGSPALALEDELMRAFELYDAPRLDPVDHASAPEVLPEEPVRFEEPVPQAEDPAAVLDEVPARDVSFETEDYAPVEERVAAEEPIALEESEYIPEPDIDPALLLAEEAEAAVEPAADVYREFDPVDHVSAPGVLPEEPVRFEEPVFEEPVPQAEDPAAVLDEVSARDISFEAVDYAPVEEHVAAEEPVALEENEYIPEPDVDPGLLLAGEAEAAVHAAPAVEAEPAADVYREIAPIERQEPRFEEQADFAAPPVEDVEPVSYEQVESTESRPPEPVFLGLQPMEAQDDPLADVGIDLERELELSIGNGLVEEEAGPSLSAEQPVSEPAFDFSALDLAVPQEAEAVFVEPLPVVAEAVETRVEPVLEEPEGGEAEPFHAETAYVEAEPQFVPDLPFEAPEEHARAMAEAEARWQTEAEPSFQAEPAYAVAVERGDGYDHDELLAEVERYPVPEARSPLLGTVTADTARTIANVSPLFSRATPVASRQPVHAEPVFETPPQATVSTAEEPAVEAEPEIDLDNFELDLSEIELALDPADFSLDDEPAEPAPEPVRRHEPAVAVPVSAYTSVRPPVAETAGGDLPFDPTMIADTDEGVAPVTELDVPQLPAIEKEKPPAFQPDYELDIDAEMAQLFAEPVEKTRADELHAGVSAAAVNASLQQPAMAANEADEFERALEEDFRQSLHQPERMAIPVDPSQTGVSYAGDGYDDAEPARNRGPLLAASVAALLLLGGGGVYAWISLGGGGAGSGEPRIILADKDPVKIVPEERGGKTVPNQDKAVYDRVSGNTNATPQQEQLVTTTEEPVDVVQRTLTPETLPFDGPSGDEPETVAEAEEAGRLLPGVDDAETPAGEEGRSPLVSPRKVKTMIVKPDGTLVAREETVSEPEAEVASAGTAQIGAEATATTRGAAAEAAATVEEAANLPAEAADEGEASLRAEQAGEGQPRSVLAEVADAEVEDTAPVRVVRTTTFDANGGGAGEGNTPIPETRPVDQPVTVVGTVTERGNLSVPETAQASETATRAAEEVQQVATANPGGYVIQIASLPSEAEARKSYETLSARFANVIGGRGVDIRRAEIPNKGTYYRVRIPAGSREEANSLCNRYKSAGGSCLVTR